MVASIGIKIELTVDKLCRADGTSRLDLTFCASAALVKIVCGNALTDDSEVIEVGLDAVVGASANRDIEFVGELDLVDAFIKALVDLFAEVIGVDQTEAAGRALAGNYGTNERSRAAGLKAVLGEKGDKCIDAFVFHALNFDGKSGGHSHFAASEAVCGFRDSALFVGCDLAIAGDNADIEDVVKALVLEATKALDAHNIGGG